MSRVLRAACCVWIMSVVPARVTRAVEVEQRAAADHPGDTIADSRNIRQGCPIPDENYCDQPYVVVTRDGTWVCLLTTGPGKEGAAGEHVVATRSTDQGKTWSPLIDIEPGRPPVSAYVTPFLTPYGRIYAFYDFNGDNFPSPKGQRVDELGWYVYRYSDDGGRTWSKERYRLPMRLTACDRNNTFKGAVQLFWGVGIPIVHDGAMVLPFSKMAGYVQDRNEGWFFRSENILTERDPARLKWELLPEGDHGVRADEFGTVQEEHNLVPLNNGDLFCVYRTTRGHPCQAFSHDGGRTWTHPEPMTYTPGGRVMGQPRACPPVWRTSNGRYLFWYHNNHNPKYNRNPAWITGGTEVDGKIRWSQPEILLYDEDPDITMSYPGLIEQGGRYWVTETNKTVARVHPIDPALLEGLWSQGRVKTVARAGLVLSRDATALIRTNRRATMPHLASGPQGRGFSIDLVLRLENLSAGQTLLDSRDSSGKGIALVTVPGGTLHLEMGDGAHTSVGDSDTGVLSAGKDHHVTVTFDAGPRILMFAVDGVLCDGGNDRKQGFTRVDRVLGELNGAGAGDIALRVAPCVSLLRIYDRPLRTSEAVANHRASESE